MTRPKFLDLFSCEGAASEGYRRAGFDVYGVDLFKYRNAGGKLVGHDQKRYPFPSHKGDALAALETLMRPGRWLQFNDGVMLGLQDFAAIGASCPCWKYSITNHNNRDYPDLIGPTRELLIQTGLPYIIENVVGAPLIDPVLLCGCMFDLKAPDEDGQMLHLQRARLFEASGFQLEAPRACDHSTHDWVAGCYGGSRKAKRKPGETLAEVAPRDRHEARYVRKGGYVPRSKRVVEAYMGVDWLTWQGLYQAIPPAYTEHIGRALMVSLGT